MTLVIQLVSRVEAKGQTHKPRAKPVTEEAKEKKMSKSTQAQAAAQIRKELKKHGIKAKVKSRSASMMTAIDITVYNQNPAAMHKIDSFCNQFQYGYFNGMEDIYENSNSRDDIPQVKYVHVSNEIDDEITGQAWEIVKNYWGLIDEDRHTYDGMRHLRDELNNTKSPVWNALKPRQRVMAA